MLNKCKILDNLLFLVSDIDYTKKKKKKKHKFLLLSKIENGNKK